MLSQKFLSIQNSNHWDQQIVLLQSLQITQQTALALNCPKNTTVVKNLLLNPRSKVITSTCIFLISMCDKYGPSINNFISNLMGTDILFKLLCSANRVIFMEIHELFKAIVMQCPQVKFYKIFATQMNSKNCQVRQCISSYLLVLSDNIQAPPNYISIVRNWKNDPSKIVRQNATKIEQALSRQLMSSQKTGTKNKQNRPISQQPTKKQKPSIVENSQIIIESFLNNSHTSYSNSQIQIDLDENIEFLIGKIYSDQNWNMKMFAIEEIYQIFQSNVLEQKNFMKLVRVFIDFLDEKRGKLNIIMCGIMKKCVADDGQMMKKYLTNNFDIFVEKAGKNEEYGRELIELAINLDPQKYIMQLAQCTIDIKIFKEKVLMLDLLAAKINQIQVLPSKIPTFIKLISKHIQKYSSNKEIYLPCLAILSHFKVLYPSQLLSCLLCQDKLILNKIIQLSQRIDPHLREAIINYIHELKGPTQKSETKQKQQVSQSQSFFLNSQLEQLLKQVNNDEENVTKLVEYVFEGKNQISVREFYQIIKLTEKVTSKDSLLELELLLQEICKTQNQNFLQALFQSIAACNGNSIQSEYILAYLRKIQSKFINFSWLMQPRHAQKLISIYRYSKCPKIRLHCIKILSLFPAELTAAYINPKQKKLIQAQQKIQTTDP